MDARLAWARNDRPRAISQWELAVAAQDRLTRMEAVLPWFHPMRESLGAALYLSGRVVDAERTFREDLRINSLNGRSLFGLWQCLNAQGIASEAAAVEAQFEEAWKDADIQLSMESLL